MKASLRLVDTDNGEEYKLKNAEKEVFLRVDESKLVIEDKLTGKSLASIRFSDGKIYLRDLGSEDGTYYKMNREKDWHKIGEPGSDIISDNEKKKEMNKGMAIFDAERAFEFMLDKKEVLKFSPKKR